MNVRDLMKKVAAIELRTNKVVDQTFAGQYASIFKGRGIEFAQVRPYIPGDDIRAIDWNLTAKFNRPFTKEFIEERELTIAFLLDCGRSMDFGSRFMSKKELAAQFIALIAFSAMKNNDKTALFLFGPHGISKTIYPQKGISHALNIVRQSLEHPSVDGAPEYKKAVEFVSKGLLRRSVVFFISDFIYKKEFERELYLCSRKHDVIPVCVRDPLELSFPYGCGRVALYDPLTRREVAINTNDRKTVDNINVALSHDMEVLKAVFKREGLDGIFLSSDKDFVKEVRGFFEKRKRK